MGLRTGTQLGPYEILSAVGAGGMSGRSPRICSLVSKPRRGFQPKRGG
jgi:hypothetical protein